MTATDRNRWWIYTGDNERDTEGDDGRLPIDTLPSAPPWRRYASSPLIKRTPPPADDRSATFQADDTVKELVNAALFLRRPLLITGKPGSGKSSLAYAVAHELNLGQVLEWPITSRSTLKEGLYDYDVIARLYDVDLATREQARQQTGTAASLSQAQQIDEPVSNIGDYLRLGPLGTAMLPTKRPRVLLIDEIDKSDVDLPNDLLHVLERGAFEIPELSRLKLGDEPTFVRAHDSQSDEDRVPIKGGWVRCSEFPFIVMTSNGEREFPPAFLRRCLRLRMRLPNKVSALQQIIDAHFKDVPDIVRDSVSNLISAFICDQAASADSDGEGNLATDQLLNAMYFAIQGVDPLSRDTLRVALLSALNSEMEP